MDFGRSWNDVNPCQRISQQTLLRSMRYHQVSRKGKTVPAQGLWFVIGGDIVLFLDRYQCLVVPYCTIYTRNLFSLRGTLKISEVQRQYHFCGIVTSRINTFRINYWGELHVKPLVHHKLPENSSEQLGPDPRLKSDQISILLNLARSCKVLFYWVFEHSVCVCVVCVKVVGRCCWLAENKIGSKTVNVAVILV